MRQSTGRAASSGNTAQLRCLRLVRWARVTFAWRGRCARLSRLTDVVLRLGKVASEQLCQASDRDRDTL